MVPPRASGKEILDDPGLDLAHWRGALREIRWVNRWLGGRRALQTGLGLALRGLPAGSTVEALDVGTGDGTLPASVAPWAARRGWELRWVVLDRAWSALRCCQETGNMWPAVAGEATTLPFREKSFDVVAASMFLHHFPAPTVVDLLRAFRRLARAAVIINDLRRSWLAWAAIFLISRGLGCHPVFRHDAPLSVLRGFTKHELAEAARQAGASGAVIRRCWAFRFVLVMPGGSA